MRFICLGYAEEKIWEGMPQSEQVAMAEECLAYDEVLLKNGSSAGDGAALQYSRTAKTVQSRNGKVIVTDGPFAETKEQLGGFGAEARDMDHAVELMSKRPGLRFGPLEIRPVDEEMTERVGAAVKSPETKAEGVKFVCLGYGDPRNWDKSMREALLDECIAFDEVLRRNGEWLGHEALQSAAAAKTLRARNGKVVVTDGPFAETKEQLGGVVVLRLRDMDHALGVWSQHPCLRIGNSIEIRPADEAFEALIAARQARAMAQPQMA